MGSLWKGALLWIIASKGGPVTMNGSSHSCRSVQLPSQSELQSNIATKLSRVRLSISFCCQDKPIVVVVVVVVVAIVLAKQGHGPVTGCGARGANERPQRLDLPYGSPSTPSTQLFLSINLDQSSLSPSFPPIDFFQKLISILFVSFN